MNASSTILFFIMITLSLSYTNVSLLNCPSAYLKQTPTENQNGFIDFGQSLYAAYQTQSNKKSIYKIVMQGDTIQFFDHSMSLLFPFIIVGIFFMIIMAIVILWCLFPRSCPPWPWTKRDSFVNPYTKKQMRYTFFWVLVFAIAILILSILIMSQIPNLKTNLELTKCSIYVTVDTALNGGTAGWDGFRQFKNNIGNISSLISSTTTQIGLYFTGDDWLSDYMTLMKTKNNIIYNENKDSKLVSPNPTTTATQLKANLPAPLIDSLFIRKGLGPVGTANTMTTSIQQTLNITAKLSNQAYLIDKNAKFLDDSSTTIKNNFILTINTLNMYIRQFQAYLEDFQSVVKKYFSSDFSMFLYVIQIIIALCMIATMLILIGSFSTAAFSILQCRKMVHIGWFIYAWAFGGGLILMYFFIGIGSVGYGFCQYYNGILTGNDVFQNVKAENSQNILNRLDVCMYGDGDVIKSFGINSQITTLSDLFNNLITYDNYTSTSSVSYVDIQKSIVNIKKWIAIIQNYKKGIYVDSNSSQTNEDNPNYVLDQLNQYSNTGGGVKTCARDKWVFDKYNCTDPVGQDTYKTTDQTNGGTLTLNKVKCISFNQGYATSYNRIWNQQDFTKRYIQTRQQCPIAYDSISKYGNTLINFRDSRINLFQGIQDRLNQILQQNTDFNDLLANFRSRVTQFQDSTKTIKNLIVLEGKGIKFTTNCSIVGSKMKDTYTVFCRNFMSQIVRMGLISIFLTIMIGFAIWASSLFAIRYSQIQIHERLNRPQSQIGSERVMSDRRSQDSD